MTRFIDPLYTNNFLDANIFDEIAGGEHRAVQEILRIYDEESITLLLPYSVQAELEDPATPDTVRKASCQFVYSIKVVLTQPEQGLYQRLLAEVAGDSDRKNIARDIFHVFESAKNGGGHFVTRDKRLLKRSKTIAECLGIEVITPESFVAKVRLAKERKTKYERQRKRFDG